MKFRIMASLCLILVLVFPVSGMEYAIPAPGDPAYGTPTSIEVVYAPDNGWQKNEDISKNAAKIPPMFGSAGMDARNTGSYLTPDLAPETAPALGAAVNGSTAAVPVPDSGMAFQPGAAQVTVSQVGYTEVTDEFYYSGGHIGKLKIPALDLSVKIYQGTDSETLAKGVGHFSDTSIWDGNVCFCGHNRGVNSYFGKLHTLEIGDEITLTTKLGTRTYAVFSVEKVKETDRSAMEMTVDNRLTLYTCVKGESAWRWCVRAAEIV